MIDHFLSLKEKTQGKKLDNSVTQLMHKSHLRLDVKKQSSLF